MIHGLLELLERWLPRSTWSGLRQRLGIVWVVALLIAMAQWLGQAASHSLAASLIYSYGISTSIWFFSDPLRIMLHRWLRAGPPHYWSASWRTALYLLIGIVLGYALGTALGDAYIGRSTWELLTLAPLRFWGFGLSTLVISMAFFFYFSQRERAIDLERQATEARLKLLETQLEPHMLFNTLANLRVLIATDSGKAIEMLDRLNGFLRATLWASRAQVGGHVHRLSDEFARLDDYLELMKVRMGPRLNFRLDLPPDLRAHPIPALLLQPLVENAIKHGLEPKVGGGQLVVSAAAAGARLVLEIMDTGVGMPERGVPQQASEGFGLDQVRQRVDVVTQGQGSVQVSSPTGAGTRVRVELPLKSLV